MLKMLRRNTGSDQDQKLALGYDFNLYLYSLLVYLINIITIRTMKVNTNRAHDYAKILKASCNYLVRLAWIISQVPNV